MNETISTFARKRIKEGLAQLSEECRVRFKLMYARPVEPSERTPRIIASIKACDLMDVVDGMEESQLDLALTQVERTLEKKHLQA